MKLDWQLIRAWLAKSPERALMVGAAAALLLFVVGYVVLTGPRHHEAAADPDSTAGGDVGNVPDASAPRVTPEPLGKDAVKALLIEYSIEHCTNSTVSFGAESEFPILDAWENELSQSGRYTLVSSSPLEQGGTSQDVLHHPNPINPTLTVLMTITINKYAEVWYRRRDFIGCLVIPFGANVLDTTTDSSGKSTTVIFRYDGIGPTDFANDMLRKAGPATNPVYQAAQQWPTWTAEHTAYLQKLDATGWRVDSIR